MSATSASEVARAVEQHQHPARSRRPDRLVAQVRDGARVDLALWRSGLR
jgi:hypothetical protein